MDKAMKLLKDINTVGDILETIVPDIMNIEDYIFTSFIGALTDAYCIGHEIKFEEMMQNIIKTHEQVMGGMSPKNTDDTDNEGGNADGKITID